MPLHKNASTGLFNLLRNSPVRNLVWPIRSFELVKFVPMALLMFAILLSYNIVRAIKDALIMTKIAPEVISFIKLWIEMPAGILIVLLYSVLCNKLSTEKVFRIIVGGFLLCFGIFVYIVYPNQHFFHPDIAYIDHCIQAYPHLKWFIKIWGQWTFVLFYVLGELWPLVVFSLLFWQLANKITTTEEAKRFYPFFSFFGQSNLLISGSIIVYFSSSRHIFSSLFINIADPTEVMIKSLMLVVLFSGIISLLLHWFIEQQIIAAAQSADKASSNKVKSQVFELSLGKSVQMVLKSHYLWLTCILLISYSMTMNLIEGLWFSKVQSYYQTTEKFVKYQGTVLLWTGVFTMICSLLGSSIIRYFGWFWGALATPVMIMIVGSLFFLSCLFESRLEEFFHMLHIGSAAYMILCIGALQNILGKGVKYSLFDSSKEMLYIPLSDELKTKGKAAVDVVGAKVGKSSGAIMQFIIFSCFPNAGYVDIIPLLMVLFVMICVFWIYGVVKLNKKYNELVS